MGDVMFKKGNWPMLMHTYLKSVEHKPFGPWGTWDCCIFAANTVQAYTGVDFLAEFRGKYHDPASAYELLLDFAGGGLLPFMDKLAKQFGWTEVPVRKAQRGDIVLLSPVCCPTDERFDGVLGVCVGPISLFAGKTKIGGVSTVASPGKETVINAWRIPTKRD